MKRRSRAWQFAVRSRRSLIRRIDALAKKSHCSRNAYIGVLLQEAAARRRVHKPKHLIDHAQMRCDFRR